MTKNSFVAEVTLIGEILKIFGKGGGTQIGGLDNPLGTMLKLQSREHISNKHFHKLNWLPINQRFKQCITSPVFKFVQN